MPDELIRVGLDAAVGGEAVRTCDRIATALVGGIMDCAEQGMALTQRQQIALWAFALMQADGVREAARGSLKTESWILGLARRERTDG